MSISSYSTPQLSSGYTLVIAEKPDAADKIASALGSPKLMHVEGTRVYSIEKGLGGYSYRVCAASGHLYGLSSNSSRSLYPTFDVYWKPLSGTFRKGAGNGGRAFFRNSSAIKRIKAFEELSKCATRLIHACDYDIEGETIGWNILRYACTRTKPGVQSYRAKFSTLTKSDIQDSFSNAVLITSLLASAGRARHVMDFVWGVNFSRALTQISKIESGQFRNLTIGRVQTPTLAFPVHREIEIQSHVPLPYWTITVSLEKDGVAFEIQFEEDQIRKEKTSKEIFSRISAEPNTIVTKVSKGSGNSPPPFPFNTSTLQSEAYRIFRIPPALCLSAAERLYLGALISYPRTDSQKLPPSLDYANIFAGLRGSPDFSELISRLANSKRAKYPVQGPKDDPAHPAIYPTGSLPKRPLTSLESKIFKLIVHRFLAAFADDAVEEKTNARFAISEYFFWAGGRRVTKEGWRIAYPYYRIEQLTLPSLEEGDAIPIVNRKLLSNLTKAPERYNQASILKKMESVGIGTKATRSQTIALLLERGYLKDKSGILFPSETAFTVIRSLENHCPDIFSEELTRVFETKLEEIREGRSTDGSVIATAMSAIVEALEKIYAERQELGQDLHQIDSKDSYSRPRRESREIALDKCPVCSMGFLRVVVSRKSGKRFIGCSSFSKGCRASAPLPQKGTLKRTGKSCEVCGWPQVSIVYSSAGNHSQDWTLCPNPDCPRKGR